MPITFHCLPEADRMVRSIGIRVAGSRSSDPSPPIRIPAYIEPRAPVMLHSLMSYAAAIKVNLQRRPA